MLDDLNLITSAGSGNQLFGAFLYSNACVVAGLRSAGRLAAQLGVSGSAERWIAFADRIWNDGMQKLIASSRSGGPGMVDPDSGRFVQARRLSTLRGFWTDNTAFLVDHSTNLDIEMLGVAVPFGLLPAADPRLTKIAESILRANDALKGDSTVLARTTYEPSSSNRGGSHSDQHDVSSLATFWMIRYLIQLGRETGQSRHWSRAIIMLEGILGRLSQLGLMLRSPGRSMESARQVSNPGGTGWRLHAMLIDTILDLAGVDYDAIDHKLFVRPILPGQWPHTGIKQSLACGEVSYRLERPIGGKIYHLNLKTQLKHPVTLEVELTCPDLTELGPWQARPATAEPALDARTGQLHWSNMLPSGSSEWNWTWG